MAICAGRTINRLSRHGGFRGGQLAGGTVLFPLPFGASGVGSVSMSDVSRSFSGSSHRLSRLSHVGSAQAEGGRDRPR